MNEKPTAQQIADKLLKQRIADELLKDGKSKQESAIQTSTTTAVKKEIKVEAASVKPKFYYDVRIECMLPATLTYRVLAEDPQQASELIKGLSPTGIKHKLVGKRDIKLSVYDAGSSMLRWAKNLLGS
jgi:hypothetical protein